MANISPLPSQLQKFADEAISQFFAEGKTAGLEEIYEWLEVDGWDDLIADFEEQDALNISYLAEHRFTDSQLRDQAGLDDKDKVLDSDRLTYANEVIEYSMSGDDGHVLASLHAFPLVSSTGQVAFVGCMIAIHGQGGPHCDWWGLWESKESFYNAVAKSGDYWVTPLMGDVSDEAILKRWKNR